MILAIDVHYEGNKGIAAGVAFADWNAQSPANTYIAHVENVSEYAPGNFYQRELPCIQKLIDKHLLTPRTVVIDGYVYLDGHIKPGLGKYLYDALKKSTIIIGVAKNPFFGVSDECKLFRGNSSRPLYVTCAGESLTAAKHHIATMAGNHRIPYLLKIADQTCKTQCEDAYLPARPTLPGAM